MAVTGKCVNFLQTTSAKGIPRIVKTQSIGYKAFWAFFTFAVFVYGAYNVATLLLRYYSYESIVHMDEKDLDTTDMSKYPAMTICDKSAIPNSALNNVTFTFDEYLRDLDNMITLASEQSGKDYQHLKRELASMNGYFQSLTREQVDRVSQKISTFVVDCKTLYYRLGIGPVKGTCDEAINIEKHVIPMHMNCYEFSYTNESGDMRPGDAILGIEVTLFLDHFNPWKPQLLNHFNFWDRLENGAMATFHYPGKEYFTMSHSIDASPGESTTISMIHAERTRLEAPYSDCENSKIYGTNISFNPEIACILNCLDERIEGGCRCKEANDHPVYVHEDDHTIPFCADVKLGFAQLLKNQGCVEMTRLTSIEPCVGQCKKPCHESTWEMTPHSTKWPTPNQIKPFLQQVIDKGNFPYDIDLNNSDISVLRDFVENNFLQIRYSLDDHRYLSINDMPKMTSVDLFSALGGSLNLWMGITVFVFIELMELIVGILQEICGSRANHTVDPETRTDQGVKTQPPDNSPPRVIQVKTSSDGY